MWAFTVTFTIKTSIFLHDPLAHDDAATYQVWLQKVQQLRRYPDKVTGMMYLPVTLTLTTRAIKFSQDNPAYGVPSNQAKLQKDQISILESHILIIWSFTVSLILKTVHQSFWKTLWLTITYNQIKFGCKKISSSEDIAETVIFWSYQLFLWPWL